MSAPASQFWNPVLETLPPEKLVEIELKNFREHLGYAQERSAFYGQKLAGVEPGDIKSLDDLKKLPLTEKEDLRLAQLNGSKTIYGDLIGVEPAEVTSFRQTSGTTGQPVYVPESYESWQWRVEVWCHILWMAGFRETDRVFVPFGYNVYVAFWEGHYAAEKLGCEVVPGGALDTKGRLNKIKEVKATALLNTPTYGLHLAEAAKRMGLDPKELGIERMLCAGEPLPQATHRLLEKTWGAEVYDHIGGTEPCAWAAMCQERDDLHIMEPFFVVEVLDLETQTREVAAGELGLAVVTPLGRRSLPLIRFNPKDVVRKGQSNCPCGRGSLKILEGGGRADHLTKVRGVLFSPVAVEKVLRGEFPQITEYEVVIAKKGFLDEISLKFETEAGLSADAADALKSRVGERLKMKTNLRFNITIAPPDELPRYTLKSERFKDLRRT